MTFRKSKASIHSVVPRFAVPGGRVTVMGNGLGGQLGNCGMVTLNGAEAHVNFLSDKTITFTVPEAALAAAATLTVGSETFDGVDLQIARKLTDEVHPVDSPAIDAAGNVYTTLSGRRGESTPVSVFNIHPDGTKVPYLTGIMNPTSLAFGPDQALYVSSRFNGTVYRAPSASEVGVYADGLGVATGIAFDCEGSLFVGDRGGTIYEVKTDRSVRSVLAISSSVAAFHLAFGPDGSLYITNPDISSYDSILRVRPGSVHPEVFYPGVKRPQGMAFDDEGNLYVAKAMAGDSGILRITPDGKAAMIASGPVLIGVALDRSGNMIVAGSDAIYSLPVGARAPASRARSQ